MPHDKGSPHDTNVTPSPLVSSDNNSQLENTRLKEQSHIISSNHSIQHIESCSISISYFPLSLEPRLLLSV
jgi:hypothetical protein